MGEPVSVDVSHVEASGPGPVLARGGGHRRDLEPRARPSARLGDPVDDRSRSRGHGAHHRADSKLARLQRLDEVARPVRVCLRLRAGLPAAAGHVPLDRDPAEGDRPQHALGRRRLRRARPHLPGRPPPVPARLSVGRRHHLLAASVPLRRPVRPLDGLPRPHPQPRPRGLRRRDDNRTSDRARHPRHRRASSPAPRS